MQACRASRASRLAECHWDGVVGVKGRIVCPNRSCRTSPHTMSLWLLNSQNSGEGSRFQLW